MTLVKALALIIVEVSEHLARLHVVAVDDEVVGGTLGIAEIIHKKGAVPVLFSVVIMVKVKVTVAVDGLHDRIIYYSIVNFDPSD